MRRKLLGLALVALAASPAPAFGAPTWLDETAPFASTPTQRDGDVAMAPDGTVVFADYMPAGDLVVRERPPGGQIGPVVTIERVTVNRQPFPNVQVLAAPDGTAAVLFDAGNVRYASLRPPGGPWGRPEPFLLARATRGQAALAPDGVLWGAGTRPESPHELAVFRLPHQAPIRLPPVPNDEIRDETPSITVPRAGEAHVIYAERATLSLGNDRCAALSALRAADVTAAGSGPKQTLAAFDVEGTEGANGCTAFQSGEVLFPAPRLTTDSAGGETAVFGVLTFDGLHQRLLARHREAGSEWPDLQAPTEHIADDTELRELAGAAAVLGDDVDEGSSVAVRRSDGHWAISELTGGTPVSTLRAASTGAGTSVFAWTEYGTGGKARARVLGADGVLGPPFTLTTDGTDVLGVGGDAEGNAVALYSRQQPDSSFTLAARGFDAAGPRLSAISVPERGRVGVPLDFAVSALDVWSTSAVRWAFGDGTFARGLRATHAYGSAGAFTVRLRAVDGVGNATTATRALTVESDPTPEGCAATNSNDVQIPDLSTAESPITIGGCAGHASATATVAVHIVHTYIGDLVVTLIAPDGSTYLLHNRAGGSTDNIDQTYTVNLSSEPASGTWRLRVQDMAAADVGRIDSWTINL